MTWLGKWRNQCRSILEITCEANHRINGTFRTLLRDSGFYGRDIPVLGVYQVECIGLSGAGCTPAGGAAIGFTGIFREERLVAALQLSAEHLAIRSSVQKPCSYYL
jgi:hypothetical protein